jgi:hypothetical protein
MVSKQQRLDWFHLRRGESEPGHHGLFFDAFDPMNRGKRISVGQHGKALDDRFLVVLFAVKDRSLGFGNRLSAGSTLPALAALAGQSIFSNISGVHAPVIRTILIPAK